jgi:hypothetical protein
VPLKRGGVNSLHNEVSEGEPSAVYATHTSLTHPQMDSAFPALLKALHPVAVVTCPL